MLKGTQCKKANKLGTYSTDSDSFHVKISGHTQLTKNSGVSPLPTESGVVGEHGSAAEVVPESAGRLLLLRYPAAARYVPVHPGTARRVGVVRHTVILR